MDNTTFNAEITALKQEYLSLLDKEEKEQVYQKFLENNTRLIPRDHVLNHGISCNIVLRKLSYASDFKSDFFFLSKSSVNWHAVHIEIEKPSSKYFKGNSCEFHKDFLHAQQQINDWRAWLLRNNGAAFRNSVLPLMVPQHMASNPIIHKYILVYGRRAENEGNSMRQSLIASLVQNHDVSIMSFDSLAEELAGKPPVNIGVRKNAYIDVMGDELFRHEACGWIEPTLFRLSEAARNKLLNMDGVGPHINRLVGTKHVDAYKYVGEHVRVRSEKQVIATDK
ncbi:Shedu immune nuclease family protein [Brucella anthropi]|uniref:Shedu immune nuclease family protein n=1 Tax=Brucella anthropi TaxID=529 RepID=UPI00236194F4|nr:Shedu immune nuclease family protein [Brucella anthropi]